MYTRRNCIDSLRCVEAGNVVKFVREALICLTGPVYSRLCVVGYQWLCVNALCVPSLVNDCGNCSARCEYSQTTDMRSSYDEAAAASI